MKLMMSNEGLVTEDGELIEGVGSVSIHNSPDDLVCTDFTLLGHQAIYEGKVKPPKEKLEPKLNEDDNIELKLVSNGWVDPGCGTKVIDIKTGRMVSGIKSVSFEAVAGETLARATICFNHLAVDAGLLPDGVRLDFEEAIKMDRRKRNLFNRFVRFPIEIKWYAAKRLFKKLW